MEQEFTLRQLQAFVAVAEELHFRRAAERLNVSQPPLTRQLVALERNLGFSLFERTTRRVALTPAGGIFLTQARQVLAAVDRAKRVAQRALAGQMGSIRVAYVEPLAFKLLPAVLPRFRSDFPDVGLELHEMDSRDQVNALRDDLIDIALLRLPIDQTDLEVELIGADRLVITTSEKHSVSGSEIDLRELAKVPFITYSERLGMGIFTSTMQACAKAGFVPQIVHRATSTPMLMSLVAAGEGVALIAEPYALMPWPGVRFVRIKGGSRYTSPIAAAWRRGDDNLHYQFLRSGLKRAAKAMK